MEGERWRQRKTKGQDKTIAKRERQGKRRQARLPRHQDPGPRFKKPPRPRHKIPRPRLTKYQDQKRPRIFLANPLGLVGSCDFVLFFVWFCFLCGGYKRSVTSFRYPTFASNKPSITVTAAILPELRNSQLFRALFLCLCPVPSFCFCFSSEIDDAKGRGYDWRPHPTPPKRKITNSGPGPIFFSRYYT